MEEHGFKPHQDVEQETDQVSRDIDSWKPDRLRSSDTHKSNFMNLTGSTELPKLSIAGKIDSTDSATQKDLLSPKETEQLALRANADKQLAIARNKLYELAGGTLQSDSVKASSIDSQQLLDFLKGPEFRDWVAAEKSAGNEVFWPTDIDKTLSSGDLFTHFFKWRADNNKFSSEQLQVISDAIEKLCPDAESKTPEDVLKLWQEAEAGGKGINIADFFLEIYWPSQKNMSMQEKQSQVNEFAPSFAEKIYPGVPEINKAIEDAGAHVVAVSNGDQDLAKAIAPLLGIKQNNVAGSETLVDKARGKLLGEQKSYEMFDPIWSQLPQPGKAMRFSDWLKSNEKRFGWDHLEEEKVVIAGFNGDSASADGGMMILSKPKALGNFMVDTPGEPGRLQKFHSLADQFAWTKGQYITLHRQPSKYDLSSKNWQ